MYHTEVWRRCEAFDSGHFQSKLAEEKKKKIFTTKKKKPNGSSNCGERIKKKKSFVERKFLCNILDGLSTNFIDGHMR